MLFRSYQNYDKSEFDSPAPLLNDDDALETIWKSEFSLKELISDKEFKSYDKLKERLDKVLGIDDVEVAMASTPKTTVELAKENIKAHGNKKALDEDLSEPDLSEDEDLAFFSKLAEED